jgi:hypothetical protein
VYVIDWSDTGDCHERDGIHRLSGRVFRLTYTDAPRESMRLPADRSLAELVKLHEHPSEWFVRQARRELANRAAAGKDVSEALEPLRKMLARETTVRRLRALWTLATLDALDRGEVVELLDDSDEHLRVWALRLLVDLWPIDTVHGQVRATKGSVEPALVEKLVTIATRDSSGLVRLVLASTLQRLPAELRPALAAALASDEQYAADHNLPKLLWYGLAPLTKDRPSELVPIAADGKLPLTREWIARALAEEIAANRDVLDELLRRTAGRSESVQGDIVRGLAAGLAGHRRAEPPPAWKEFAASLESAAPEIKDVVRNLSVVFGDGRALAEVRQVALDSQAPMADRRSALRTLIDARPDDLQEVCQTLLRVRFLNTIAMQGLTRFDDPAIGEELARHYGSFHPSERAAVIEALVARPSFARGLLNQIEAGKIPRSELSALHARQIRSFGDAEVTKRLSEVWGELRESPSEKRQAIEQLKTQLSAPTATGCTELAARSAPT